MASSAFDLKQVTIRGTAWNYASHYSGKILTFISTLILARLLLKEDFGLAGYAIVIIRFLDTVDDLGIGPAIIFHHDDEEARNTAFWLGLGLSLVLLGITWFIAAPLGGMFFNDVRAVELTRGLSLIFPLFALFNIHQALLRKRLAFAKKFIPDLFQALAKGGISIGLAFAGFGAWSLVWGQVGGTAMSMVVYWWVIPWRPSFSFVTKHVRPLLSYGLGAVSVDTIAVLVSDIDYFFVGRMLGAAALGAYTLAFRIPELIILQFCRVLSTVIFPVYVKMRDDPTALSRGYVATTRYVALVTVPVGLGIAILAEPFVLTAFTEKWAEAIPVMRAIAIYALLLSMTYHAGVVYKAKGIQGLLTRLILLRAVILIPALWWATTVAGSLVAVGWVQAGVAFIGGSVNMVVAARKINTPITAILGALRPAVVAGAIMSLAVYATLQLTSTTPAFVQLFVGTGVGVVVYAGALWWMQRDLVLKTGSILRTALARS